jgi:CRP-like cAMP-binding protein
MMADTGTVALTRFLRRLDLRSRLGADEQDALLAVRRSARAVSAYTDIVRLGEHVDHICLVAEGYVGRFDQIASGARQIVAIHIPGDMADLPSVVSPKAGWALQSLTPATIVSIPHEAIRALTRRYPALTEAFWRDCVVDGSIFAQGIVNVGRRDAEMRLAHLLCELSMRLDAAGLGTRLSFPLPLTQAVIADALGLTQVHVNRTFKRLRDAGILSIASRSITIHDWDRLARQGEFDATYLLMDQAGE